MEMNFTDISKEANSEHVIKIEDREYIFKSSNLKLQHIMSIAGTDKDVTKLKFEAVERILKTAFGDQYDALKKEFNNSEMHLMKNVLPFVMNPTSEKFEESSGLDK